MIEFNESRRTAFSSNAQTFHGYEPNFLQQALKISRLDLEIFRIFLQQLTNRKIGKNSYQEIEHVLDQACALLCTSPTVVAQRQMSLQVSMHHRLDERSVGGLYRRRSDVSISTRKAYVCRMSS